MLMVFLTKHLQQICKKKNDILAFFFCNYRNSERNSAATILRALIYQIIKQRPRLSSLAVEALCGTRTKHTLESRDALWLLFIDIINDPRVKGLICAIDGLDECDEDSATWLAGKLTSVAAERKANDNKVKILVASRSVLGLEKSVKLDLDQETLNTDGDLSLFIKARLHELQKVPRFDSIRDRIL